MQRGDIWWANLPEPVGHRPVVLVNRDHAIRVRDYVIVAPVTTRIRHLPVEVSLGPEDGLSKPCVVNCDVLMTISKTQLDEHISLLSAQKRNLLNEALRYALEFDV